MELQGCYSGPQLAYPGAVALVDAGSSHGLESTLRSMAARLVERDASHLDDPERLIHMERLPAVPPRYGELSRPLPAPVWESLGVDRLYSHQAEALDLIRERRSVAVATSTSSGKSLVYQAAIGEAASQGPSGPFGRRPNKSGKNGEAAHTGPSAQLHEPVRAGTALCIYPTKALGHDQLRAIGSLDLPGVLPAAYDGDTGTDERTEARRNATVICTNPEMLHCGILPHHVRWMRFLSRLSFVVIDEMHLFRGIFGSHVAHVIRRLRRLAAHYGADPTFICTSATVGRPAELASALTGVEVTAVTDDGSPRSERSVAIWNPPLLDAETGSRASAHGEAASLVATMVNDERRVIGFCPSRKATELVTERVRRKIPARRRSRISAYRGGYLSEERLEIEDALTRGQLDAVITTSALELGVDLPDVDVCVLDGFPGTVSSMWQRIGRAGRRERASLAIVVCGADQLDQWVAANPEVLLRRPPEPAVINPENPFVADPHLRCAAFELPLTHADEAFWPGLLDDCVRRLVLDDELVVRPPGEGRSGRQSRHPAPRRSGSPDVRLSEHTNHQSGGGSPVAAWNGGGWPTDRVGLRSGSAGQVKIVRTDSSSVGTVDRSRAGEVVHDGAVYLHAGRHYRVVELNLDVGQAVVEPDDGETYTTPITRMDLRILGEDDGRDLGGAPFGPVHLGVGPISVTTRVTGYTRKDAISGEVIERCGLDLPPSTLQTRGVWRVIPAEVMAGLGLVPEAWPGVLHAAEHAAIGVLPLFAICDRWDVGGISTARHADTGEPTIVIYDGYPGGAGIAELGFEVAADHWAMTADLVAACPCHTGCPSCVQSPKCGNGNEPLDKLGAVRMLSALTQASAGRSVAVGPPAADLPA